MFRVPNSGIITEQGTWNLELFVDSVLSIELTHIRNHGTFPADVTQQSQEYGLFGMPRLGRFWTVSNFLSILRIILTAPVVYLIVTREPGEPAGGALLSLLDGATQYVEGRFKKTKKAAPQKKKKKS